MKKIISFLVIIGLIVAGYIYKDEINSLLNKKIAREVQTEEAIAEDFDSTLVSTIQVQKNQKSYIETIATVKAETQLKIYPSVAGQITKVNVKEGQSVKKGTVLFEIGGLNDTKHTAISQLEIAENSYNMAVEGYNQTIDGNQVSENVARIQLNSARNQYDATNLEMQSMENSIDTAEEGAQLLEEILDLTEEKNEEDLEKLSDVIDDLNDASDSLYDAKDELQNQLDKVNADTSLDAQLKQDTINTLTTAITDTDKKISELEGQIETTENSYSAAETGTQIAEDQLQIQLNQSENAAENLEITKESTEKKLGLNEVTYDPLRLANQNYVGTQIKSYLSLVQAESQLTLAEINLEMMRAQANGLFVKAPADGIIAGITVNQGDMVSPQSPVSQLIGSKNYEAEIYVDIDTSKKISKSSVSEIKINGKYIPAKIKTISPLADPISKLVKIVFSLPQGQFSVNENAEMKITIVNTSANPNTFFIPLDSVIIGTEEKYVYIFEEGKAKKTTVEIADIIGENAKISKGLSSNDKVIVDGAKTIIDGQNVYVKIPRKIAKI
ncbi:efflux RND transporter periplasmic adaptor subunit [Candidatus Gracilibacteria bacterium]|nr:efflux RND transporter periplasmic adaptor subunit [Candidatus Gracilibacteria bacterium]